LFEECRFDYIHKQRNSNHRGGVYVEFWNATLKVLTDFYIGYMIPELLSQKKFKNYHVKNPQRGGEWLPAF